MTARVCGLALLPVVAMVLVLGACGTDDVDQEGDATSTTVPTTALEPAPDATAGDMTEDGDELPEFSQGFRRLCDTQEGFSGTTAYSSAPGPHPILMFWFRSDESYSWGSPLPEWGIEEDDDIGDTREFAALELVGCSVVVQQLPTGVMCQFGAGSETVSLEVVNARYEVTVYEAATGERVKTTTLETDTAECPFAIMYEEGQTQWLAEPSDDDYANALRDVVLPAG